MADTLKASPVGEAAPARPPRENNSDETIASSSSTC
jgi:hypothetical protein